MRLGIETNSLVNHIYSTSKNLPEVGKGATKLWNTDRYAYEVIEVSKDKKKCLVQRYVRNRIDNNGLSDDQTYQYDQLENEVFELVYRYGKWQEKSSRIEYIKEEFMYIPKQEAIDLGFFGPDGTDTHLNVVEGYSKVKTYYTTWDIVFGVKNEYIDLSF